MKRHIIRIAFDVETVAQRPQLPDRVDPIQSLLYGKMRVDVFKNADRLLHDQPSLPDRQPDPSGQEIGKRLGVRERQLLDAVIFHRVACQHVCAPAVCAAYRMRRCALPEHKCDPFHMERKFFVL